jgi:hypothetical protein
MIRGKQPVAWPPGPRVRERHSPAIAFVRACGHASLDETSLGGLRQLGMRLDEGDWNEVLGYALVERMECLTYTHLSAAGLLPQLPASVRKTLAEVYAGTLLTNLKLRNLTVALTGAFAERGIQAVCLKGVVLGLRHYRDIAHRPVGDIDFLVRPADVERSAAMLVESGFRPIAGTDHPLAFQALRSRALGFERADGIMIELHWALTGMPPYAGRFESSGIWHRLEEVSIRGRALVHLHRNDELRYLCFHYAAQHRAERLIWLVDIVEMLPPNEGVRPDEASRAWEGFVSETISLRLALPITVALVRARRLLGAPIPQPALDALGRAAESPAERSGWRSTQDHQYGPAALARYVMALHTPRERLAFLAGAIRWGPPAWARWGGSGLARLTPLTRLTHHT